MTRLMRTWRTAAVAGLTLGAFACSESSTDLVEFDGPFAAPQFVQIDLTTTSTVVNGARWNTFGDAQVGTGNLNPFLGVQASPMEEGFNTDFAPLPLNATRSQFTDPLPLNFVPVIDNEDDGFLAREFILDANESNATNSSDDQFSIDFFDLYLCDTDAAQTFDEVSDFTSACELVYEIGDGNFIKATDINTSGSGNAFDYQILIPNSDFEAAAALLGVTPAELADCTYQGIEAEPCGLWLILHVKMGGQMNTLETNATFEEFSTVQRPFVTVEKTAETSLTREHMWDIMKSVDIDEHNLFTGQSGDSKYTVEVTYEGSEDSGWEVEGDILITNPSDDPVTVNSVTDEISGFGAVAVTCPGGLPQVIEDGESLTCTYGPVMLPDGSTRTNTATVLLDGGGSGSDGAAVDFSLATVNDVNETVNIEDSVEGALGSATAPDGEMFMYTRTFTCDEDEGQHDNTAEIIETGQTDDASVVVNCDAITVDKTVVTTFTRTWTWEIDKEIDPTGAACGTGALMDFDALTNTATIQDGQILDVCYTVEVDANFVDTDWHVSGVITITNMNPTSDAELTSVSDLVSPDIAATVDCGGTLTVPAGGTLECDYDADLPDGSSRTNVATAVLFGVDYDSPTKDVIFGDPTTEIDECIDVNDTFDGFLGTVCASDPLPHTFDYVRTITGEDYECGPNTFDNTAEFTTNDTATQGSDDETLNVEVECEEGCTLTQGYWKTHNDTFHGGASKKADDTWFDLGDVDGDLASEGENETFYLSGGTYFDAMWTAPKGNMYWQLARQFIAATLNSFNASTTPEVDAALLAADVFFSTYSPAQAAALPRNDPGTPGVIDSREEIVEAAGLLASYNEGDIGPGHCTENEEV